MTAEVKPRKPTGEHSPVSNRPEDEETRKVKEPMLQQPSAGPEAEGTSARGDIEEVEGYRRTEMTPAERWIVPKTDKLRDIGEASFGPPTTTAHRRTATDGANDQRRERRTETNGCLDATSGGA